MECNGTERREGGIQRSATRKRGGVGMGMVGTQSVRRRSSFESGAGAASVRVCLEQLCHVLSLKQWRLGGVCKRRCIGREMSAHT
jgi:hypothetical protein